MRNAQPSYPKYSFILPVKKELKNIHCSNKMCKRVLGLSDGKIIRPANDLVFSKLLTYRKKHWNPLYCIYCHRITRWYQPKLKKTVPL